MKELNELSIQRYHDGKYYDRSKLRKYRCKDVPRKSYLEIEERFGLLMREIMERISPATHIKYNWWNAPD